MKNDLTRSGPRRMAPGWPGGILVLIALALPLAAAVAGPDDWEKRWEGPQPVDKFVDAVGIEPGMTVGEIGAGRGRYAVLIAAHLGSEGRMIANDIDADALAYMGERCERDGITNMEILQGKVTDPCFPAAALDFIYVINTYHHFEDPTALMRSTAPALKPDGRLVIVEHDPAKMGGGSHSTPPAEVIAEVEAAGFVHERTLDIFEMDGIYIFRVVASDEGGEGGED